MIEKLKKYRKFIAGFLIWALLLVAVLAIVYWIPGLSGALKSTYIAEYDTVYVSEKVECYLVKTEAVVYAENSGQADYSVGEGSHVRSYTGIAKVGSKLYTNPIPGLVSYTADGYEYYFTEENLENINKTEVNEAQIETKTLGNQEVFQGEPIFKVVDDKKWYMIFWVDKDSVTKYAEGSDVSVVIDDTHKVKATIDKVYQQDENYMVVLKTYEYYDKIPQLRSKEVEVIVLNETGLLILQESIVTKDGHPGVYVRDLDGSFEFVRVKVLYMADNNAIVAVGSFSEYDGEVTNTYPTINSYDEILKNAKSFDKGGEKIE